MPVHPGALTSPFRSLRGYERYGLWVLKKSIFPKIAKKSGIENV
jgi:hypothetical protein